MYGVFRSYLSSSDVLVFRLAAPHRFSAVDLMSATLSTFSGFLSTSYAVFFFFSVGDRPGGNSVTKTVQLFFARVPSVPPPSEQGPFFSAFSFFLMIDPFSKDVDCSGKPVALRRWNFRIMLATRPVVFTLSPPPFAVVFFFFFFWLSFF